MQGRGSHLKALLIVIVLAAFSVCYAKHGGGSGLRSSFYRRSCPQAETIVRKITWAAAKNRPSLGAQILRVHYHDCFVRGCDASVLLDTVAGSPPSEKDARPNLTLLGFELIDEIKTAIEKVCPNVVSCADILALAARDAVSFPFHMSLWPVFTGRRDGRVSLAAEANSDLPSPSDNFTSLFQLFDRKGLDLDDLVALSGAHTIGRAHCRSFTRRFNLTGNGLDPTLDPSYADFLKTHCPTPVNPTTTVEMDPGSSLRFDTSYYRAVVNHKGLFQSDAALLTDPASAIIVRRFQRWGSFFPQFVESMVNMGAIEVLAGTNGEIRKQCRIVN